MKIALITDTHMGVRNDSTYFMRQQKKYYDEHFFPYLLQNNISTIIHGGDLFDKRKQINFESLNHTMESFMNPIIENGMKLHLIVGNHDSYFKASGDLISTKLLFLNTPSENLEIYDTIREVYFGNKLFLMVPWIFPNQKDSAIEAIKMSDAENVVGHFEMINIAFQGNTLSRKGIEADNFKHFANVFSGHYHKPSEYYIGSPYQMTWNDYGDKKRIMIYDTDTGETESVYLGEDIYVKMIYDGSDFPKTTSLNDKIVRVVVKSKDSIQHFENYIAELEKEEPFEIDIKDEYLYINIVNDESGINEKGTLEMILESVDDISDLKDGEKMIVKEIITKLYEKAVS